MSETTDVLKHEEDGRSGQSRPEIEARPRTAAERRRRWRAKCFKENRKLIRRSPAGSPVGQGADPTGIWRCAGHFTTWRTWIDRGEPWDLGSHDRSLLPQQSFPCYHHSRAVKRSDLPVFLRCIFEHRPSDSPLDGTDVIRNNLCCPRRFDPWRGQLQLDSVQITIVLFAMNLRSTFVTRTVSRGPSQLRTVSFLITRLLPSASSSNSRYCDHPVRLQNLGCILDSVLRTRMWGPGGLSRNFFVNFK